MQAPKYSGFDMSKSFLQDPDFLADPAETLDQLRRKAPLAEARLPIIGRLMLTTTDAAAREVLKDETRFARNAKGHEVGRQYWWMPPFMRPLMRNMILMDGAEHKRLRRVVEAAFSRTAIDDLRPEITRLADRMLADLPRGEPVNITAAYTRALPLRVICSLLGIPDQDRDRIVRWIEPIAGPTNVWALLRVLPGMARVMRHFRADFARVRSEPRPGLISDLVSLADEAGLTEDELVSLVFILFVAGHETTVYLLNDAIVSLMNDAQARQALQDGSVPVERAVEEFMRYWSPVLMTKPMVVTRDTEVQGCPIAEGTRISAFLLAANHDPSRFDDAGALKLGRLPNAHIGFGFGPHVCLGMQLARAETQIALQRLLAHFPDAQLARPPEFTRRVGMRGPRDVWLNLG